MRMWHYRLIPSLPDLQLKGQLRELVAIMRCWKINGSPNHLLVNNATSSINDFYRYWVWYDYQYQRRFGKPFNRDYMLEVHEFCKTFSEFNLDEKSALMSIDKMYPDWHNKKYLRVCMANLYEKYAFGLGDNKISEYEWNRLSDTYKQITQEDYVI